LKIPLTSGQEGKVHFGLLFLFFGAVAGVPTAPHRARLETGPSPQVFEKIPLASFFTLRVIAAEGAASVTRLYRCPTFPFNKFDKSLKFNNINFIKI
jgi:hypothetical protein